MRPWHLLALAIACSAVAPAGAVERCVLDGQQINPNNGSTTAGKTGLVRCSDGGAVVREQELQNGVFMGAERYFRDGQLERDYRVDAHGNREGNAREYARAEGRITPVLVREETYRDGHAVGLVRSWYPSGQLSRVAFLGDDDREIGSAEFTSDGKLFDLQCGARPTLGADADDAHWCGHIGAPSTVVLFTGKGVAKVRVSYDHGERRRSELLDEDGAVRELQETIRRRRCATPHSPANVVTTSCVRSRGTIR